MWFFIFCIISFLPEFELRSVLPSMIPSGHFQTQKFDNKLLDKDSNAMVNNDNEPNFGNDLFDDNFIVDDTNTLKPIDIHLNTNTKKSTSIPPEVKSQDFAEQINKNGEDFRSLFNLEDVDDDSLASNADPTEKEAAEEEQIKFRGFSDLRSDKFDSAGENRRDYIFLAMENILNQSKVSNSILDLDAKLSLVLLEIMKIQQETRFLLRNKRSSELRQRQQGTKSKPSSGLFPFPRTG